MYAIADLGLKSLLDSSASANLKRIHTVSLTRAAAAAVGWLFAVPLGEERVPLFAITEVPYWEQHLAKGATGGFDHFSHFEVFPTLLLAMGYDADWVNRVYGPSLLDSPSPDRKFMIGSPDFQPMMVPVDRNFGPAASPSRKAAGANP
jgi:hypothetical protein